MKAGHSEEQGHGLGAVLWYAAALSQREGWKNKAISSERDHLKETASLRERTYGGEV